MSETRADVLSILEKPWAYVVLTKPDVTFLVVITTVAGFYLGSVGPVEWLPLLHTLCGTLLVAGGLVLLWFFLWVRAKERAGEEPLLSTSLFRNRTSNLGLVTQNVQWLLLLGVSFVVAALILPSTPMSPATSSGTSSSFFPTAL